MTGPSLGELRRARGMPPVCRTPGLQRAGEIAAAGHARWIAAVAHLVLAGRPTTGCGAAAWAREQVALWLEQMGDADLDDLADAMLAEWQAMCPRPAA